MWQSIFFPLLLFLPVMLGSKVLMIPAVSTSHCLQFAAIGRELLLRGHEVTLLSVMLDVDKCTSRIQPDSLKRKLKVIVVNVDTEHKEKDKYFNAESMKCIFERKPLYKFLFSLVRPRLANICEAALSDSSLWGRLENEKFDLALVDGLMFTSCFATVAVAIDVPLVAVSSYIDSQDSRTPLQSNTLPALLSPSHNEMTFPERLLNAISAFVIPGFKFLIMGSFDPSKYHEKLRDVDAGTVLQRAVLFLENSDYIVDYPKAVFPNFVQVGGLTAGFPVKPLTGDLKSFMDTAKDGVLLVTFGSLIGDFPQNLVDKLMSVFHRLNVQVLFNLGKESVDGNVKTTKWLPQNDVLAHPNTKVFLAHCGKNGFWESLYHGVPIICMPIHAETFTTAIKVKKYQIGASLNIFDDSVEEMVQIITNVLENATYSRNMKRMSMLHRDRPETAPARAASAIEHVLKYGSAHLQPPSHFGFISYIYADVWFVIFTVFLLVVWFDVWLFRKCCCRSKAQAKQKRE